MTRPDRWLQWLLATAVVGLAAVVRTRSFQMTFWPRSLLVGAVAVVASTTLLWAARRGLPRWTTPALAALAGFAAASPGGRIVGVWVSLGVVVASWVVLDRPPWATLHRAEHPPLPQVIALHLGATVLVLDRGRSLVPSSVLLGLAVLVTVAAAQSPDALRLLESALRWVFARLAVLVTAPLLAIVWLVCVLLPWVSHRVVGWDPLAPSSPAGTGWGPRRSVRVEPARMWLGETSAIPRSAARRVRSAMASISYLALALAAVALVVLLPPQGGEERAAGAAATVSARDEFLAPDETVIGAAMLAAPWWDEYNDATERMWAGSWFTQYAGSRLGDVRSRNLNVQNGRRRTWVGSSAGCTTTATVWMYGGSTTFGVGQRDDHTLPSVLSQVAANHGVHLVVENFGVPGDVGWLENRRVLEHLERTGERPDLVVFYDGYNDLEYVHGLRRSDRGGPGDLVGPLDRLHMKVLDDLQVMADGERYVVEAPDSDAGPPRDHQDVVDAAAEQYRFAHREARRLLRTYDVPMLRFNQPTLRTRAAPVKGETHVTPEERRISRDFIEQLPDDVIDLSTAFDEVLEPVYNDAVHTSEEANPHVAELMLPHVLAHLVIDGGGVPCS